MMRSLMQPIRAGRVLELGMVFYLAVYAFEGPVRYVLLKGGADSAIVLRDAVLALLLLPVFFARDIGPVGRKYLTVFVAIIGLHSIIIYANFNDASVIGYTAKEFMPILYGAILGRLTGKPSRFVIYAFAFFWGVTVIGLVLDKFVTTFPWTGLSTVIGGIKVDVGHDWQTHGFDKRVGGFTRSSIHAALFLPLMSMMLLVNLRHWILRLAVVAVTCACVLLTTQKGALIGYVLVSVCFLLGHRGIKPALKGALLLGLLLTVSLPLLLNGTILSSGGNAGTFSISSFALRTGLVWPDAIKWIDHNQIFPFGVGIGGIGGAQRLYAPEDFNPADNMFLFLYGSFGLMAIVYVGFVVFLCLAKEKRESQFDLFPRAVAAFHFTYGAVLSIIEDQSSCMILGLSIGYLLYARRPAESGPLVEPPGNPVPWRTEFQPWRRDLTGQPRPFPVGREVG